MANQVGNFMFRITTKLNLSQLIALGLAVGFVIMGMPTGGGGGGVG